MVFGALIVPNTSFDIKLLEVSLVDVVVKILVGENSVGDTVMQTFERHEVNNTCKNNRVHWFIPN